ASQFLELLEVLTQVPLFLLSRLTTSGRLIAVVDSAGLSGLTCWVSSG
ncbi:hypothetical protein Tco_1357692, partial [Tanacetum coccineum]